MRTNPKVTLLIYDLKNPLRNVEIRGTVIDMSEEGALEHLDHLTQIYYGRPDVKFFGDSVPVELKETRFPVRITIAPTRIRAEG